MTSCKSMMETNIIAKILVAIDDSDDNQLVFQEALTAAKQNGAQLLLLHVLSTDVRDESALTRLVPYSAAFSRDELVKCYREQRQDCEQQGLVLLKSLSKQAEAEGISVQFHQPIGNPRDLICYFAQTWQADLIVMGRRQHSWLSQWWTGSVSKRVSNHAPCRVQVVQCQQQADEFNADRVQSRTYAGKR